jgi:putative membrane protein
VKQTYQKYLEKELVLRDKLAIDRTILANERTFLSYIRTALTMFIAGGTVIKLISEPFIIGLGWLSVVIGVVVLYVGILRFKKFQQSISVLNKEK